NLLPPATYTGDRLPCRWSKERPDRAPGKIDREHATWEDQVFRIDILPSIGEVSKLSLEWLPRRVAGRSKTVRAEAANEMMVTLIVTEQAVLRVVKDPALVARLRLVSAPYVESAVVSVAPTDRKLHEGNIGAPIPLLFECVVRPSVEVVNGNLAAAHLMDGE